MRRLLAAACAPYRAVGFFHYHWARGKLGHDPMFPALLELGVFKPGQRVLDLGCGRGLLAAWFLTAERLRVEASWPAQIEVPVGLVFHGVDLHEGACGAGHQALQAQFGQRVSLTCGDMCQAELQGFDAITLLDVLHYISHAQQVLLLDQIRAALSPDGVLVMRVGNALGGWRFRWSYWVDLMVARAQGHHLARLFARPVADWTQLLQARGFAVSSHSMSSGTAFANVLLVARVASVK
jgi:2-polyprenyl-3-methyl-5-hydroxy-6-metoxy-1,4-benzoquinol methylase